jgi:hypothetical protein
MRLQPVRSTGQRWALTGPMAGAAWTSYDADRVRLLIPYSFCT